MAKQNKSDTAIVGLRKKIYTSYDALLKTGNQQQFGFPIFYDTGDFIYYSQDIEDDEVDEIDRIEGKSYLIGEVVSRESLGGDDYKGIIVRTKPNGIELFENYSKRNFKPILLLPNKTGLIPNEKGLIADLTALEENPDKLEGCTPKEITGINFESFPLLKEKFEQLPKKEYQDFYKQRFSHLPLFF